MTCFGARKTGFTFGDTWGIYTGQWCKARPMAHLGFDLNQYGTMYSRHVCDTCGEGFTVTPAVPLEGKGWDNCTAPGCASYDVNRDIDRLFDSKGDLLPEHADTLQVMPVRPRGVA